jgi:hypothetical protein
LAHRSAPNPLLLTFGVSVAIAVTFRADVQIVTLCGRIWATVLIPFPTWLSAFAVSGIAGPSVAIPCSGPSRTGILDPENMEVSKLAIFSE